MREMRFELADYDYNNTLFTRVINHAEEIIEKTKKLVELNECPETDREKLKGQVYELLRNSDFHIIILRKLDDVLRGYQNDLEN